MERTLFAHLAPLVAPVRLHAIMVPQDAALPAVRYTSQITHDYTLCGSGTLANTSLQLDVFAHDFAQARTLREAVVDAMRDFALQNVLQFEFDGYDPESKCFQRTLQYSVWEEEQ
jgi:hypothetical protein